MSLWTYRGLGRAAPGGFVPDFYVASLTGTVGGGVNGSPSGNGSISSPWDLQTAFNGPAALVAHVNPSTETNVVLRGGLYINATGYTCNVNGVLGNGSIRKAWRCYATSTAGSRFRLLTKTSRSRTTA